jgi:hypothetical protein
MPGKEHRDRRDQLQQGAGDGGKRDEQNLGDAPQQPDAGDRQGEDPEHRDPAGRRGTRRRTLCTGTL